MTLADGAGIRLATLVASSIPPSSPCIIHKTHKVLAQSTANNSKKFERIIPYLQKLHSSYFGEIYTNSFRPNSANNIR